MTTKLPLTPSDRRHGTQAGALAHRRQKIPTCDPCQAADRRARKRAELWRSRGVVRRVPVDPRVWQAVTEAASYRELGRRVEVPKETIRRIVQRGPQGLIHVETQAHILKRLAEQSYVTTIGLQRRLEALSALGWSMRELSERSHPRISTGGLTRLRARTHARYVKPGLGEAIARLYGELSMTIPPAGPSVTRTVQIARDRGYLPPLAWDDETIDDPQVKPYTAGGKCDELDESAIYRRMHGDRVSLTKAEQIELVHRCLELHWEHSRIEHTTGLNAVRILREEAARKPVENAVDNSEAA